MILTILKSLMFWKYRWINITTDGLKLHGIVKVEYFYIVKELLNKKDE